LGRDGRRQPIQAIIDTGFSGFLTLPPALVASLGLTWLGREPGVLADGREELFDVYRATILWDDQPRTLEVEAADTMPLLGMGLLHGNEVNMCVVAGGEVTI